MDELLGRFLLGKVKDAFVMHEVFHILKIHATSYLRRSYIPHVVPFGLFAVCTYTVPLFNTSQLLLYPNENYFHTAEEAFSTIVWQLR